MASGNSSPRLIPTPASCERRSPSELRATLRAYSARLEISLAQTTAVVANSKSADELLRDELHKIRDLTQIVRNRKLKPEKGRRKDLRKLDCLIEDLNSAALNGHAD